MERLISNTKRMPRDCEEAVKKKDIFKMKKSISAKNHGAHFYFKDLNQSEIWNLCCSHQPLFSLFIKATGHQHQKYFYPFSSLHFRFFQVTSHLKSLTKFVNTSSLQSIKLLKILVSATLQFRAPSVVKCGRKF